MSETTNLKLKKHDNPSTNKEQFDVENYLNGNWDKIDKNVGEVNTNISNINLKNKEQDTNIEQLQGNTETSSNKIAELEKELKEAQEDFYQNSIRGQASGEYIHVEDSSNCRSIIELSGNSEQETRSGKNKIDLAKCQVKTLNGVTSTYNKENNSITFSGTCTVDNTSFYITENGQNDYDNNLLIKKNYTLLEQYISGSVNGYAVFRCSDKNWGHKIIVDLTKINSTNKKIYNTYSESDTTIKYLSFRFDNGTVLNNFTVQLMLTDTVDTEYEMYGASPSPDYLSEIESVGSNVNIYDKEKMPFKSGLWIGSTPDSNITTNSRGNYVVVPIVGGKKYTISKKNTTGVIYATTIESNAENGVKVIDKWDGNSGLTSYTIKTSSTAKYLFIGLFAGMPSKEEKEKCIEELKVEEGTVATPSSPPWQGCVKVTKCNKNIFKPEEFSIINQNVTCSYKDGKFTLNGEVTSAFTIDISKHFDFNKIAQLTVNKNVTFSIQKYTGNIDFELNLGSRSSFYILQLRSLKKTKITKNLLEELTRFSLYVGVGKYNNFSFELQLEIGDNQTVSVGPAEQSYIMPTQQSMKSIKDIRDTFIKKDGKWYERHNIYRYVFDGNENFKILDSNSKFGMIVTKNKAKIVSKNDNRNLTYCLSNRFVNNTQFNATKMSNKIAFSQWSDTQYLYLSKIKDSVDELKNYLAANETYVDYPLETPIDLECTEEQSKILDELNNARTYKNVTNITTDSKAILSLDYAKDLETLLNNTQALAVNNASEGV